jgi:hypothetical protein
MRGSWRFAFLLAAVLGAWPGVPAWAQPSTASSDALDLASPPAVASWWDREHRDLAPPPLLTPALVETELKRVAGAAPDLFALERIGESVEGRPLYHLQVGRGPVHILLWSQMHGDEPTATRALFDVMALIERQRATTQGTRLLDALTLHVVPMLNPDGAERYQRRNAQSIDVNRDALLLQSPEARALKALRDRTDALLGFNLHNQGMRTSIGTPPRPASISLLSVAFDDLGTENEGRRLTKRVCAVIRDALDGLAEGRVGRYAEEFEVRAMGDNLTRWGTSVVLIETGAWPGPDPDSALVRLNFVALVNALDAIASGRVHLADPARYDSLPVNDDRLLHTIVRGATIVPGTGVAPFLGDVGIGASRTVRVVDGQRTLGLAARIDDIGDLRTLGALETIDGRGLTLTPAFDPAARPGDTVTLPDWKATPAPRVVAVGQPAALFLLRPAPEAGKYLVVQVVQVGDTTDRALSRQP